MWRVAYKFVGWAGGSWNLYSEVVHVACGVQVRQGLDRRGRR